MKRDNIYNYIYIQPLHSGSQQSLKFDDNSETCKSKENATIVMIKDISPTTVSVCLSSGNKLLERFLSFCTKELSPRWLGEAFPN